MVSSWMCFFFAMQRLLDLWLMGVFYIYHKCFFNESLCDVYFLMVHCTCLMEKKHKKEQPRI